jgi:nicotinamidase/pyrazinamidase
VAWLPGPAPRSLVWSSCPSGVRPQRESSAGLDVSAMATRGAKPSRRVLVDVDTQVDFVEAHGALFAPAADGVTQRIEGILRDAESTYDAVIGSVDAHAYDAWEFEENGGPFPAHCVKGTPGWLRVWHGYPRRNRFVPMQSFDPAGGRVAMEVGEKVAGGGNRQLDQFVLSREARSGVGLYFEKEIYSLFSNPVAEPIIGALVEDLGGRDAVVFDVMGYCTGGYCVDGAAQGLAVRGYRVRILGHATAPLGGAQGEAATKAMCSEHGIVWIDAGDP